MSQSTIAAEEPAMHTPSTRKKFYEDKYAVVSFDESIPCISVILSGVPHCSEHYKLVHLKVLQCIQGKIGKHPRLHLLTDSTKAGIVLEEDLAYYKMHILPAMGDAGIRYHAIVLPKGAFGRFFMHQVSLSTEKLEVKCFNTAPSAYEWLTHC